MSCNVWFMYDADSELHPLVGCAGVQPTNEIVQIRVAKTHDALRCPLCVLKACNGCLQSKD